MCLYICHHCVVFRTPYKKDMVRHFTRQHKCKANTIMSFDESFDLSVNKKFFFININTSNLSISDYIYIVYNYIDEKNYIDENFRKKNSLIIKKEMIKEEEEADDSENESEIDKIEFKKNRKKKDDFYFTYYNEDKDKYICNKCFAEYTTKQNLQIHIYNTKLCEANQKINELHEKKLKELEIRKAMELKRVMEEKKNVTYNINNNNTIGNLNNIQNIQNHNNNVQNTNYNISIKDFIHERYDITHIQESYYQKKDFFLFTNLLKIVMENKKNQNIFFTDNHQEAIIYTDNELNRISSDKAGYLILDKLSQTFDQILYKQDEDTQEYYKFIQKYYTVLKGQYKHDTIYKDYDVDEQRFIYTANSSLFRCRDKNLQKMISTLDHFNAEARETMKFAVSDVRKIPLVNPNIEDFASIRNRYRDLKD